MLYVYSLFNENNKTQLNCLNKSIDENKHFPICHKIYYTNVSNQVFQKKILHLPSLFRFIFVIYNQKLHKLKQFYLKSFFLFIFLEKPTSLGQSICPHHQLLN